MLFLNTIDPPLFQLLSDFCSSSGLADFSLVGGTAVSLQLGHGKSNDVNFFTDRSFFAPEIKKEKEATPKI
jgi:hypothetical protein